MWDFLTFISPYAISFTIPLLITSLGGLICERSGVVNIGLEGLMVIGSFASALTIVKLFPIIGTSAIYIGLVVAIVAGMIFSLLHAFASINLNANQVISGTAINMIAGSLTLYFARYITGSGNIQIISGLRRFDVPFLHKIPIIGKLFFTQTYSTTWLVVLLLLCSAYLIYKTPFGLRIRACGEHPHAADAAGINVKLIRYIGVLFSGAFAGLGGAIILVTYSGEFTGSVAGLGFLALAALIFGQWKPLGILGATFFFGFASTLANVSQIVPALARIPGLLLKAFPYVLTLIALVFFSKTTQAPRAAGEPFDPGKS
ncbi:ABC transporter, permease protein [Olavius algarvensis spirochete endosymbiont]|uniref:ABC transporter permease n=1 Tax=Olavius algarvensis spirochete endosymbiont TaxID=260710 RepID=UPI000F23D59C|nr:ABC transporter permease [Olavius algarvensis spirochete endosymbiont]VDB00362.1 ABC transporter, permease protein [Olavius algarvensis spirochete endosymbiont]